MNQHQLVSAVLMACVLILLGVLPGLLDLLLDGTERLHHSLLFSVPALRSRRIVARSRPGRPLVLAAVGIGIICLSGIAYWFG